MLLVTNQQLRAVDIVRKPGEFADYMQRHLAEHFPAHTLLLTQDELYRFIGYGLSKAETHGFTTRYEACLFIDMMVMLGSDFDQDVQLPWAASALSDTKFSLRSKIDRLYKQTLNYLNTTIGKDEVFSVKALRRMLQKPQPESERAFRDEDAEDLLAAVHQLSPAKARFAGIKALRELVVEGAKQSRSYGVVGRNAVAYITMMMFVFGSGVCNDPFYPWVNRILTDESLLDESQKLAALYQCVQEKIAAGLEDELIIF